MVCSCDAHGAADSRALIRAEESIGLLGMHLAFIITEPGETPDQAMVRYCREQNIDPEELTGSFIIYLHQEEE